jgi:hypothetical protein
MRQWANDAHLTTGTGEEKHDRAERIVSPRSTATQQEFATGLPFCSNRALPSFIDSTHISAMAKHPEPPKKSIKTPKSKAHRPDVQPIGPALAELLNPAINRGDAGMGSGTGLQPPPDNSKDRRSGGEAAIHRARASTPKTFEGDTGPRPTPLQPFPQPAVAPYAPRLSQQAFEEAPQAVYGTTASIPPLDPELA